MSIGGEVSAEGGAPPSGKIVDPLIGQTLDGRFEITSLIARGGMGKVFRAKQAPLGRVCAVKVLQIKAGDTGEGDFHRRFLLEASTCAKLTHPNTVTIFDYGCTKDGVYYMAMEYLEGRTLQKALREEGPFTVERAIHVVRQIGRSLREAHALGVIHRDLKPANVYLVEHGDETDMAKVLDFGLVKSIEPNPADELTQAGLFMGSPKYMAPEQIRGEHVDGRTDVYALGIILFELLAGKVPFDGASHVDIFLSHINQPIPSLRAVAPNVPPYLEEVLARCLAKNADDRYRGMEELLLALRHAGGDHASSMTTTGPTSAPEADLRRSGALAALTTSVQPGPLSGSTSNPSLSPIPPAAQPKPSRKWAFVAAAAVCAVVAIGVVFATKGPSSDAQDGGNKAQANAATQTNATATNAVASATTPPVVATTVAAAPAPTLEQIELNTDPQGARVEDDQHAIVCDKTPCKVSVGDAPALFAVSLDGYAPQRVRVSKGDPARQLTLAKQVVASAPVVHAPTGGGGAAAAKSATAAPSASAWKGDPYGGGTSGPY